MLTPEQIEEIVKTVNSLPYKEALEFLAAKKNT